jgi:hypothetical protein
MILLPRLRPKRSNGWYSAGQVMTTAMMTPFESIPNRLSCHKTEWLNLSLPIPLFASEE